MQINPNASTVAAQQIAQSIDMLNQLNQSIVDKHQDLSGKLLRVAVEDKITTQKNAGKIDLLA